MQQLLTNVLLEQLIAFPLWCQLDVCLWAEEGGAAYKPLITPPPPRPVGPRERCMQNQASSQS